MHIDPTLLRAEPRNVKQVDGEMASHSGSQCDAKSYWHWEFMRNCLSLCLWLRVSGCSKD